MYIYIAILLFILLFFSFLKKNKIEKYRNPTLTFLSRDEAQRFIDKDADNYIKDMSEPDIIARKSKNHKVYKNKAKMAMSSFTFQEKNKIVKCFEQAMLVVYKLRNIPGLDFEKMTHIPFSFAKMKGKVYENGFPHTRLNVIFLNKINLSTILHEIIHVYQRTYPILTRHYTQSINCFPFRLRKAYKTIRSNPDLDEWTYVCNGQEWKTLYNSNKPNNITDVKNPLSAQAEHPFEYMAYYIASFA